MFEHALSAHIPIIGVTTDDLVNFQASLQILSGLKVLPWPTVKSAQKALGPYLYWTDNLEHVTVENYKTLAEGEYHLVVVNPEKSSPLVFDAGVLPTPGVLIKQYVQDFVAQENLSQVLEVLKGLSLKTAAEVVQLTMARSGACTATEVRRTRTLIGGAVQGLYAVDTELDYYLPPKQIQAWLGLNSPYFLSPSTPPKLVPRGLMLAGSPGVGKSMASKAIANHFKIPLFRLDISTTLGKYVGESENRVARSLGMIERESPCVLLLDEVEKIFAGQEDTGVTSRILSQLLWWLSEHRARVLTIMTTNKIKDIPPELYRTGRVDAVVEIVKLGLNDSKTFASQIFQSVMCKPPSLKQQHVLRQAIETRNQLEFAHSEVAELVYEQIKLNHWFPMEVQDALNS